MAGRSPGDTSQSLRLPRRRDGCSECRRKKVKCDLRRPVCSRCIRFPKECRYDSSFVAVRSHCRKPSPVRGKSRHPSPAERSVIQLQASLNPLECLTPTDSHFFMHHFATQTIRVLFPLAPPVFGQTLVATAVETPHLLHALLAASCSHHARLVQEPSANQLTILRFTDLAVTGLRAALANPAETLKPETAMTAMVLCTNDVCNGNARTWKVHLSGVMQLLTALLARQRTADVDTDPFSLCLLKWFATLDILAGLSGTHEGCVNDGQYWNLTRNPNCGNGHVDEICGYSTQLMPLLARIGQLARRNVHEQSILETFTEPSSALSEELTDDAQDLESRILSIANQAPSAATLASHDQVLASELHNTHLTFIHSALLHLYRRVELLPKSHTKVRAQVAAILDNVQAIRPFSPANVLILWPIFSAGCETDDLRERQAIQTRMLNMQTMGMGNFTRARDALARYWGSGASSRWDVYFAKSGLELVLF
ncbi:transcription factor domain-containing protein [Aspergillus novofumigatus IBT 16806]|uniref:Zn(2)-C6 fungal-type domain-containing protein n=1 Tax=Aspergillus novofumigatus (strain IBT 16806) TaxID=1392255 RepID=A0A2I1CF59_ASPN1|nr:uncharacterized protein P174DRAFT_155500 [Aspergillus novofumigatus IBT 16806]PKX96228.1 hypothetical protein P174DRAFT_155500 [Aspergillus novofumigatus IBT 16806]